jgi:DNA-binding transcriptional regulator YiaG
MVFNKKSITAFNNIVFTEKTICLMQQIHETVVRLYAAAKELRSVTGQSAVARLLEVTPQVVKNWEKRGLSSEGALLAQRIIGCNANWLLGTEQLMTKTTWAAPRKEPEWPFTRVTVAQVNALSSQQKKHIEDGILIFVGAEGDQSNQSEPDPVERAA